MSHSHAGHHHSDGHSHAREGVSGTRLVIALLLNVGITVAEIIGGIISGSLSLLADAAHNASDAASIGISYGAHKISEREADRELTFGYNRAQLIGAMINLTTLFVIGLFLLWQAVTRLINPPEVEGTVLLIVGAIAFVEDALSVWVLYQGSKESLNIRSAFIHLVGDTLATLGVIIGGLLIMFYDIHWVDPLLTAVIAVYIVVHGYIALRKTIRILMESAPKDFDFDGMVRAVENVAGVQDLHHVHLWRLDETRVALEAHVAVRKQDVREIERIKGAIKEKLHDDFHVDHSTLEIEIEGRTDHDRSVIPEE